LREHNSGTYRTDVYFICKQLADLPIFLITPVLFMSIYYYMVGLYGPWQNFVTCVVTIVLVSQCAIGMGYMASCISPSLPVALAVGPTIFVPLMNFGGFYQNAG
jgi:ABC-type multidrug transport system permease subunit